MTIARSQQIDPSVTRWYHCVSRCVRRAFLLDDQAHDRKGWIENRIESRQSRACPSTPPIISVQFFPLKEWWPLLIHPRGTPCKTTSTPQY